MAEDKRWLSHDDNTEDLEKGLLRRNYYMEPEQPPNRVDDDVNILPDEDYVLGKDLRQLQRRLWKSVGLIFKPRATTS